MTARIFNLDDERLTRTSSPGSSDATRPAGDLELLPSSQGFSGAISLPLLPDLIQIYTVSMADGALTIRRGTQSGTIWFDQGAMVHAVCGELTGEEAVYRLLQWHDGQFSLDTGAKAPFRSITASWQKVLMEGCRRLDEAALEDALARAARPAPASAAADSFGELFTQLEQDVRGFVGAAVLDGGDGSLLAQRPQGGGLDFEAAAPMVAELLRQQVKIMAALGRPSSLLDSLAILGDQVHLLEALPEGRLLYLVVAKHGVNLAAVRRVVDRALGRLT
jgi:Domain of unknown function (DUF4388)